MVDSCPALRQAVQHAKLVRNNAMKAHDRDENDNVLPRHSDADMEAFRLAVDMAAMEARNAGCDVDDLVGPNVGNLD